jgi:hypothetical protein
MVSFGLVPSAFAAAGQQTKRLQRVVGSALTRRAWAGYVYIVLQRVDGRIGWVFKRAAGNIISQRRLWF